MIAFDGTHVNAHSGAPTVREIGVGLGRTMRFAGQTHYAYPVLAHSIVVASLVRPAYRLHALLHDAHEAIMGDTVTEFKTPERRALEDDLQWRIHESLGLPAVTVSARAAIKRADLACLAAEAHVLGRRDAELHWPAKLVDDDALKGTRRQLEICAGYIEADYAALVFQGHYEHASTMDAFVKAWHAPHGPR